MSLNNGISETSIAACCRGQAFWLLNGAQLMLRSALMEYEIVDIMQHVGTNRVIGMIMKIRLF
jgi:hypothetical protein